MININRVQHMNARRISNKYDIVVFCDVNMLSNPKTYSPECFKKLFVYVDEHFMSYEMGSREYEFKVDNHKYNVIYAKPDSYTTYAIILKSDKKWDDNMLSNLNGNYFCEKCVGKMLCEISCLNDDSQYILRTIHERGKIYPLINTIPKYKDCNNCFKNE